MKPKFRIPNQYAFSIQEVANLLNKDQSTIRANTNRMPDEKHYIRAFKITKTAIRIKNTDLAAFINRTYFEANVQVPNFYLSPDFELNVRQIAKLLNCNEDTVRDYICKKGTMTFEELENFISRNYLVEPVGVAA